ncbi:MAG: hypothetical protein WBB63_02840 [Sphingobacterium thalpophilum]
MRKISYAKLDMISNDALNDWVKGKAIGYQKCDTDAKAISFGLLKRLNGQTEKKVI